ncbi:protein-L-isoaspartate(D-aspartate) O-methyltransferase [Rhizorhabdus argentea]|uniref:protein-L-isoaspartate(D-aspartate) O-methyltransferase n=1 Tax=Rhizorhabdus argentea TaxID=1387174 RepID=UPI0030ED12D2
MKQLTEEHLSVLRRHMVEVIEIEYDLMSEEIGHPRPAPQVRAALLKIPRHRFVPLQFALMAYQDRPLPIGFDKTISQPFMSALMVDMLELTPASRVLEVGTGLGYQTALLAELAEEVWSVDVVEEFIAAAASLLQQLDYANVSLRVGDGTRGWADAAPFDAILVSAAAREIPEALIRQLKPGGRLVLPVGDETGQRLAQIRWDGGTEATVREIMSVMFTQLETV